jgi:hypothetical protein
VRGQRHAPAALPPEKNQVPILQEVRWAPEPVCNIVFPRDIVCLSNMCINTLHKGDSDYDNNNNNNMDFNG